MRTKTKPTAQPRPPISEDPPQARALYLLLLAAEETAARLAADLDGHECREPDPRDPYDHCELCDLEPETRDVQAFLGAARLAIHSFLFDAGDGIDRAVPRILAQLPGLLPVPPAQRKRRVRRAV